MSAMVDSSWDIRCPSCGEVAERTKLSSVFSCDHCGNEFLLRGHLCPACYSYSTEDRATCINCGEALSRHCSHCGRPNWPGHPACYNCGHSQDIFDSLSQRHSPGSTADRLNVQMLQARTLKAIEDAESQKRMRDLTAVEEVRQKKILERQVEAEKRDRRLLFAAGLILLIFILLLVFYSLFVSLQ